MFSLLLSAICVFSPPASWETASPKNPSPYLQVGFLGKGGTDFRPSMTLAVEEVDVPLKEYMKAVKEIHQESPKTKWRDLGRFSMQAGEGRLIELSNASPWGEMKVFQAIIVHEGNAYILSASVLKEELARFQNDILKSFRSMAFVPDLGAPIADLQQREKFQNLLTFLGQTDDEEGEKQRWIQEVQMHRELGSYWQYLALQEGLAKITKRTP